MRTRHESELSADIDQLHRRASHAHLKLVDATSSPTAFVTLTFNKPVSEAEANRMVRRLFHLASRRKLPNGSKGLGTHLHWSGHYDLQPVRGIWHFHLLVEPENKISFSKLAEMLDYLWTAGNADIQRYEPLGGAAAYIPLKHEHPTEGWGCPKLAKQCRTRGGVCKYHERSELWNSK
jgi:hypothetical protein